MRRPNVMLPSVQANVSTSGDGLQSAPRGCIRQPHRPATIETQTPCLDDHLPPRTGIKFGCSLRSIFQAIIDIFEDLSLKCDQSRARLPPRCANGVLRFNRQDLYTDTRPVKHSVKNPAYTTCGEDFNRDNEHRGRVVLCPLP